MISDAVWSELIITQRGLQFNWFSGTMHTASTWLRLILLFGTTGTILCANKSESCRQLYDKGVEMYLENYYEGCVAKFEEAVERYRAYTKKIQTCRLKCHNEAALHVPLYHLDVEDLYFYEKAIRNTLCIIKCKNSDSYLFDEFNMDEETINLFENRKPYEYLHNCYYKTGDRQRAASAAFTYLVANPNDEMMVRVLKQYSVMPEVDVAELENVEAKDFVYLYVHGTRAYEEKNWEVVVQNMEESIASFLQSEDECRAQCEGPFKQNWYPDLIPAIANHFTHSLHCKRKCKDRLSTLNGEKHDDLFPSHYHYLQYAYFKTGNMRAACASVTTYLLFFPQDETMLYNLEYYEKLPKVQADYFKARPEALHYFHRDKYEEELMNYIYDTFKKETAQKGALYAGGKRRFVLDEFVSAADCATLLATARAHSVSGDGYRGTVSPHTIHEIYSGLTLNRIRYLLNADLLDRGPVDLLIGVSKKIKRVVERKFAVSKRLHFAFTHLVCRTAVTGMQENRKDLSHSVHADNCNVQTDGSCPKKSPAFTWRDFTAILYLNNEFTGGEFFFAGDFYGRAIERVVRPTCGKLVGFTSGRENLHGVKAVRNGTRCALAIWFTYDRKMFEKERTLLYKYNNIKVYWFDLLLPPDY